MKFTQLWKITSRVHREIAFQSMFSLRMGGRLPQREGTNIRRLVQNAELNTLITKILTSILIGAFGFSVFTLMGSYSFASTYIPARLPPYDVTVLSYMSLFLMVILFLIVVMGLQVSTSLVSSRVAEILTPLALPRKDTSTIMLLSLLRIFDVPLLTAIGVATGGYYIATGSVVGTLIVLVAVVTTEIFSLALAISLSKFFYAHIMGSSGRSRWKGFLRMVFIVLWILPVFGTYLMVNLSVRLLDQFASLTQLFSSTLQFLSAVYPFSYGFLTAFAARPSSVDIYYVAVAGAASLGYTALGLYAYRWLTRTVSKLGTGGISTIREKVKDTLIHPRRTWLGIIVKDLRMASRSPALASLFLLPALQTVALALSFYSFGGITVTTAWVILLTVAGIMMLVPPVQFSIESFAATYTRTLPLTKKILILAKTFTAVVMYLASMFVLVAAALYMQRDFSNILTYGTGQTLPIAAACMLELNILAKKYWKEGAAIGNIYARLSTYILVIVPGLVLAGVPLIAAFVTLFYAPTLILPVFVGLGATEFLIMAMFTLHS